ncbi:MAG: TonB-dependent receptor [Nitrospirae bacterium]|nr:TonB-dependent receptor [Candidatus Manganitrophaceae bacterium]
MDPLLRVVLRGGILSAFLTIFSLSFASAQEAGHFVEPQRPLTELSLEELMNVEVVTYSKRPEKWFDTPAAIYVITQEDLRRSGVTNIPDALRLAPGVEVARIDSNRWAVGIRGFTSQLSRDLLVLIDGRSVYSPLYAGVFWEVQDLLLEDIDRIEVIRGPGGTVWGANAVNGVINIITKNSRETPGGLATLGGGTQERGFGAARYGGAVGDHLHYRVYGKYFNRDGAFHPNGDEWDDGSMGQGGFRADLDLPNHSLVTLQGDLYNGRAGKKEAFALYQPPFSRTVEKEADLSGGNLLFRWSQAQSEQSDWTLKVYYDRTNRKEPIFREDRDTVDFDFQHRIRFFTAQELMWGVGYRVTSGDVHGVPTVVFDPPRRTDVLYTAFLQYRVTLIPDRLDLTLGSKFEHNDYSGFEVQPSGRLLWKPTPKQAVWTAVTRAVRTPSRLDQDLQAAVLLDPTTPTFLRLVGTKSFEPEEVLAYEVGYRIQPLPRFSFDITPFYNQYSNLSSLEPHPPFIESTPPDPTRVIVPLLIGNRIEGRTYGVEFMTDWQVQEWWRVNLFYSLLRIDLTPESGSLDRTTEKGTEGTSPHHQVGVRSLMELPENLELDWFLRYVDKLPSQRVKSYYNLDLRLGWHPTKKVELALVGQNLLDSHHPEFGAGNNGIIESTEVERSVYGKVTFRWD